MLSVYTVHKSIFCTVNISWQIAFVGYNYFLLLRHQLQKDTNRLLNGAFWKADIFWGKIHVYRVSANKYNRPNGIQFVPQTQPAKRMRLSISYPLFSAFFTTKTGKTANNPEVFSSRAAPVMFCFFQTQTNLYYTHTLFHS